MENFPNDYSYPNAIASEFDRVEARLDELEDRVREMKLEQVKDARSDLVDYLWGFGAILAMILSWSRNASILCCIGHGILSWIYAIYFAFTR